MNDLRIEAVAGDALAERWRHVHDVIVPPAAKTPDDVRGRLTRGYRRDTAYAACSSAARPPQGEAAGATVAARVLPEHRGQGHGTALHAAGTAHARGLCAAETETGVPAADTEGPRLAAAAGFTERERYVPDGRREERADLRLRAG